MHLDYFEYMRNKNSKDLSMYTKEELAMFSLLEDRAFNKNIALQKPNWAAIPGGVPSKYIVGIMTDAYKNPENQEFIKQASKIFGVPIINSQLKVVYQAMERDDQAEVENAEVLTSNTDQQQATTEYAQER